MCYKKPQKKWKYKAKRIGVFLVERLHFVMDMEINKINMRFFLKFILLNQKKRV